VGLPDDVSQGLLFHTPASPWWNPQPCNRSSRV